VLLARQFCEMTRLRLEGLLAAFPKLLSSESGQHTFIDTESIRYVYQALESDIYLVLLTNKSSNLVEDLHTVQLVSKVIPDVCCTMGILTEEAVLENQFELIFALDEVISESPVDTISQPTDDPISVTIEEKINCILNREGGVESMEIKGSLFVSSKSTQDESSCCSIQCTPSSSSLFNFQTHPKINKKLWEGQNILQLRKPDAPFPSSRVAVLRWGFKGDNEDLVPLNITCWPVEEGNSMNVNVEYMLSNTDLNLEEVRICIPLPPQASPEIITIEEGSYHHDYNNNQLIWYHSNINSNNDNGSIEFNVRGGDSSVFYPMSISFYSTSTLFASGLNVEQVTQNQSNNPVAYSCRTLLSTDAYLVQ